MPRHSRAAPGGYVYHALNRAVARLPLFEKEGDYAEVRAVRECVTRGRPYGEVAWRRRCTCGTRCVRVADPRRPRQPEKRSASS
jgi:hypothetical protein